MTPERVNSDRTADADAQTWRMLALSGIAFAVLFVVGFLLSGGDTPDYSAPDQEWTKWADDNESNNQVSVILSLLAGVAFLLFAGIIRSVLGAAEATERGFAPLARAAFAGAVTGITGIVTAIVMIGAASFHGSDSNPAVSRAVIDASAGPFLLASMGFAALLGAAGLLTLRTGVFGRWTAIVALIGSIGFLVTFLAVTDADNGDTVFGIGYPIGFLCLAIWSIATSLATFRKSPTTTTSDAIPASSA
jgi:hypothetical protein